MSRQTCWLRCAWTGLHACRLDAEAANLVGCYYNAHRPQDGQWLPADRMPKTPTGQPIAYVALGAHGLYTGVSYWLSGIASASCQLHACKPFNVGGPQMMTLCSLECIIKHGEHECSCIHSFVRQLSFRKGHVHVVQRRSVCEALLWQLVYQQWQE